MFHSAIHQTHIILYVANQIKSTLFYKTILQVEPSLNVPGMTEFKLSPTLILGLMPESGIANILQDKTPHPSTGNGIPRCELYFILDDIYSTFQLAIQAGATTISEIQPRNWGDTACYMADPDGHILAFAQKTIPKNESHER